MVTIISCLERYNYLGETLKDWEGVDGGYLSLDGEAIVPRVILDREAIEDRGITCSSKTARQEYVSKYVLEEFLKTDRTHLLFLEDDVIFNRHLGWNLKHWEPLACGLVDLASLYNPNIRRLSVDPQGTWFVADPEAVYGSQGMILSRRCAEYTVEHWGEVPGMQDIKFSRLCAQMGGFIYYHLPSLVQHVGKRSAWTDDRRFHDTKDFDREYRAAVTER